MLNAHSKAKPRVWETKIKVGDRVRLNDYGLEQTFGSRAALGPLKLVIHTITRVDLHSITEPEQTFVVEVADHGLNQYLLSDVGFDPVETSVSYRHTNQGDHK